MREIRDIYIMFNEVKKEPSFQGKSAQYSLKAIKNHVENLYHQGFLGEDELVKFKELMKEATQKFINSQFGIGDGW